MNEKFPKIPREIPKIEPKNDVEFLEEWKANLTQLVNRYKYTLIIDKGAWGDTPISMYIDINFMGGGKEDGTMISLDFYNGGTTHFEIGDFCDKEDNKKETFNMRLFKQSPIYKYFKNNDKTKTWKESFVLLEEYGEWSENFIAKRQD